MELPDFMSYANKFSQSDFVEKISRIMQAGWLKTGVCSLDSVLYLAE